MGVCGNVCCVAAVVKDSGFLSLGVLKYVVYLCKGCDGCCVFCLYCDAWNCRCSCMSVSSCRCCMFVSSCGSSQCGILHVYWSQLIHPGPASSRPRFLEMSQSCVATLTHYLTEPLLHRRQEL